MDWASEEMALRKEDRDWIGVEIRKAIVLLEESLRPKGWCKTVHWLRDWSLTGAAIATVMALIGVVVTLGIFISNRLEQNATFRTRTEDRLTNIEASLLALRAAQVAVNPANARSQSEAKDLLAAARQGPTPIPTPAVEQAGKSFIQAAKTEPTAWDVALQFIEYRSSINSEPPHPSRGQPGANEKLNHFDFAWPAGKSPPQAIPSQQREPLESSAKLEKIGQPSKQERPDGPSALFLVGGGLILDGFRLRRIVLIGVEVHYDGGPMILENVLFVNCRLVMKNNANGRALGNSILSSSGFFSLNAT